GCRRDRGGKGLEQPILLGKQLLDQAAVLPVGEEAGGGGQAVRQWVKAGVVLTQLSYPFFGHVNVRDQDRQELFLIVVVPARPLGRDRVTRPLHVAHGMHQLVEEHFLAPLAEGRRFLPLVGREVEQLIAAFAGPLDARSVVPLVPVAGLPIVHVSRKGRSPLGRGRVAFFARDREGPGALLLCFGSIS